MKTIAIVLTKYPDTFSNLLYLMNGGGYTHVSLSLDDAAETMYSFNFKGFCIESVEKHRRHGVAKSLCYCLQVSDAVYEKLSEYVQEFIDNREDYRYTRMGVILCFLRIPFKWKDHYFCSQFVAEALSRTGAIKLRMRPSLYLPNHLSRELASSWQVQQIQPNPI